MTKNARRIWVVTLSHIIGALKYPDNLNEPQFSAFLFEPICSVEVRNA